MTSDNLEKWRLKDFVYNWVEEDKQNYYIIMRNVIRLKTLQWKQKKKNKEYTCFTKGMYNKKVNFHKIVPSAAITFILFIHFENTPETPFLQLVSNVNGDIFCTCT